MDSDTLVVISSVSGNTVETLTVLDSANKIGCKIIAFSDGGKVEEYCFKNNINYRKIQQHLSPRASFTEFMYSILKTLEPLLPIDRQDVIESIEQRPYNKILAVFLIFLIILNLFHKMLNL